ncbi:MAG: LysE family transporter [Dehalococcoidia bacterium]|nr:MAG: LysE family transporter [Dehalococcoidia bacterium]
MVADTTSLPLFLLSVFAISLTGAMMPGPVTAVTVTNGSQRREAGALIALGHGLIELPVILLIYFGLASFFESEAVRIGVGIGGGLVLIWMGLNMFHSQRSVLNEQKVQARGSILAGVTLTAANPYFFVWWATVGATLVVSARDFGSAGVAAMGVTHWLCDFGWLLLISLVVYKSRHLWTQRVNRVVFGICSAILAGFGSWFIVSSITLAASS